MNTKDALYIFMFFIIYIFLLSKHAAKQQPHLGPVVGNGSHTGVLCSTPEMLDVSTFERALFLDVSTLVRALLE